MTASVKQRPVLEVLNYSMSYQTEDGPVEALRNVSLKVMSGETHAIVGESGSGKSTLAWAVTRCLPANARDLNGAILLNSEDVLAKSRSELRDLRGRRISMVFQDPSSSLNPSMKLGDQVMEVLRRHRGMSREAARIEAEAALSRTGIQNPAAMMERYPHEASGGEKQRVIIATAFACNPELIIFDEPTTALDILTAKQILELFVKLRKETGVAALYISHDLGLVRRIADTVTVLYKGEVVEEGDVKTVFETPKHTYTQNLLAALPRPQDRIAAPAPETTAPLCAVENVSVRYNEPSWLTRIVNPAAKAHYGAKQISFDVRPGELVGIVGESGSGKSTIARAAIGLNPFEGRITFNGRHFDNWKAFDKAYRRQVQIVFQHPDASLNPRETIGRILARPLRLYNLAPAHAVPERVRELLETVLLPPEFVNRYPHQLSGGQKQRVAIARAFAAEPKLVICDEITAALDVSVQSAVAQLLVELQARSGAACLFITHDLNLIRQLAHRIVVMHRGTLVDTFDVADAVAPERADYTRALLNAVAVPTRPAHTS
ncbi:ABC transporter ATP-binding protein [Aquamicrobium sp. LC103]|uniref:dipeptide ABC transporter ATP-binding protein n=1 Tax=Aquamicrobium sp. LC103 TaxID=1120658 RepID=UPI00063EA50D|nr:ABC transporter ATP-binding protein [Aquamicrobium sp. LC103]TKT69767.1 ABC transporter ATP-binding protein [Aquamicrobium sp. LC103]